TDATPAASRGRLEHNGIAKGLGLSECLVHVRQVAFRSWRDRHSGSDRRATSLGLVPHGLDHAGGRTNEFYSPPAAYLSQLGVFRQEAIPRVQRVATRLYPPIDQLVWIQIARQRVDPASVRFVRRLALRGVAIRFGITRPSVCTQVTTGA